MKKLLVIAAMATTLVSSASMIDWKYSGVAADNNSRITNWADRGTSILFGDGAGAMVVTASDDGVDDILALNNLIMFINL